MKKIIILIFVLNVTTTGCLSQESFTPAYRHALRYGAKAKVTLSVSDEQREPVTNANVKIYFDMINKTPYVKIGVTDDHGLFSAEALCADYISVGVEKPGFYATTFRYNDVRNPDPERLKNGRWLPWNPTVPVVLREIRNPIPMYVKRFEGTFENGFMVGFDCERSDFVSPHGNGVVSDFAISINAGGVAYKLTTKTINLASIDPDGGFSIQKKDKHSFLKSDYLAPTFGYVTNVTASMTNDFWKGETGTTLYGGDDYLVFKSRIKRDDDGNIISANYGKIYNAITYDRGDDQMETAYVSFLYYFNPTPNDHSLEFDRKNNLFRPDLHSSVYTP